MAVRVTVDSEVIGVGDGKIKKQNTIHSKLQKCKRVILTKHI